MHLETQNVRGLSSAEPSAYQFRQMRKILMRVSCFSARVVARFMSLCRTTRYNSLDLVCGLGLGREATDSAFWRRDGFLLGALRHHELRVMVLRARASLGERPRRGFSTDDNVHGRCLGCFGGHTVKQNRPLDEWEGNRPLEGYFGGICVYIVIASQLVSVMRSKHESYHCLPW